VILKRLKSADRYNDYRPTLKQEHASRIYLRDKGLQDFAPLHFVDSGSFMAIVLPFIRGTSVQDLINERNPSMKWSLPAIISAADEVARVNEADCLHCDVKTDNFIYDEITAKARLIDFGFSTAPMHPHEGGIVYGTPDFFSLETLRGSFDKKRDVFALAVTAYETFTCRPYLRGSFKSELPLDWHLRVGKAPQWPPADKLLMPDAAQSLIDETIVSPSNSRPTAREFAARLRSLA
jgi:serine/threonine protein kinase